MNCYTNLAQCHDTMFEEIFALSPSFEITKLENGPVAISGLEAGLADINGTQSVYGIVVKFLHIVCFGNTPKRAWIHGRSLFFNPQDGKVAS